MIVRNPNAHYHTGRSEDILKVKSFFDMEAMVIGHIQGQGRNKERSNPPPLGAIITFKHYGFYPSGIPKSPSFLRIRTNTSLSH